MRGGWEGVGIGWEAMAGVKLEGCGAGAMGNLAKGLPCGKRGFVVVVGAFIDAKGLTGFDSVTGGAEGVVVDVDVVVDVFNFAKGFEVFDAEEVKLKAGSWGGIVVDGFIEPNILLPVDDGAGCVLGIPVLVPFYN